MLCDLPVVAIPFIKQGRVRALGVASVKRTAVLPDVPTISEAGLPGFDSDLWFGLFAPPQMAKDRLTRINGEMSKALASSDVKDRFATLGADPVGGTPEAFSAFLKTENVKWEKVVKASGAHAD